MKKTKNKGLANTLEAFVDADRVASWNMENKQGICCICGKPYFHFGNNPDPIRNHGRCCDACNGWVVVPERMRRRSLGFRPKSMYAAWDVERLTSWMLEKYGRAS